MDDPRDDSVRPDEGPGEEPVRSPWEPPRDGDHPELQTGAPAPPASEDSSGDDVFARLNAPATESAEEDASYEPGHGHLPIDDVPPFVVAERDLMGESERTPSRAATFAAFAIVIMALLGVLMTIATVKLFTERAAMTAALNTSADRLAAAYSGPQATDTEKRRIAWLRKAIADGDFGQAKAALDALGAPAVDRPSPLATPSGGQAAAPGEPGQRDLPQPGQDPNLPIKAQVFFEQHSDLWEAFFGFSVAIRRMAQSEIDVSELEQLRASMVDAAALGQTEKVEDLLNEARARVERQSADQLPPSLQAKLQEFGEAMQQARREQRDAREAVAFAKRSERAAQRGDFKRAEELMEKAITALKNAPRARALRRVPGARGGPRAGEMPQMGPEIGLLKFVADVALSVMRSEERDLTRIWDSINIAAGAIREKNADQIREILDEAKDSFHIIGERRRKMQGAIEQAQEQVREARQGQRGGPPGGLQRPDRQVIVSRIAGILEKVREMPEDEFANNRVAIARAVLAAMTAPVEPPTAEAQEGPELTPEQRVRMKMERAGRIYLRLRKQEDVDLSGLDETFRKVRELLTEHEYEQAEKLVDEGLAAMRKMAGDTMGADEAPRGPEDYGPQLQFDAPAPTLDLPGLGRQPIPQAPPAASTSDHTDEGAEQ